MSLVLLGEPLPIKCQLKPTALWSPLVCLHVSWQTCNRSPCCSSIPQAHFRSFLVCARCRCFPLTRTFLPFHMLICLHVFISSGFLFCVLCRHDGCVTLFGFFFILIFLLLLFLVFCFGLVFAILVAVLCSLQSRQSPALIQCLGNSKYCLF